MKKKGFTLVELLVVIAIIALLMGILMPALARVRMIANRMVCGANLSGIGKALLLYAGDSSESYPMPGSSTLPVSYATVGHIGDPYWDGRSSILTDVFPGAPSTGGQATIGSLFYMLIKYEDVSPKQFNCKGDSGAAIFKLSDFSATTTQTDVTKCYDFGTVPGRYNSYAYHFPFARALNSTSLTGFAISVNNKPSCPLAADRNPGLDKNAQTYILGGATAGGTLPAGSPADTQTPYTAWENNGNEYKDKDLVFNSATHQREGQNVLYNDGHVKFETQANVGVDNDNIYQRWAPGTPGWATPPATSTTPLKKGREAGGLFPAIATTGSAVASYNAVVPGDVEDAVLINEVRP
jgi:prepilin-type N-terminal cleavage/methylation domain-containing protein